MPRLLIRSEKGARTRRFLSKTLRLFLREECLVEELESMEITFPSSCYRTLQPRVTIRRLEKSPVRATRETLARWWKKLRCKSLRLSANRALGLRSFLRLMIARVIGKISLPCLLFLLSPGGLLLFLDIRPCEAFILSFFRYFRLFESYLTVILYLSIKSVISQDSK